MTPRSRNHTWAGMALLLLLLFAVGGWLRNPPPRILDVNTNLPDAGTVPLGAEVTCQIRLVTSWRQRPDGALRIELPEGISLAPGARVRLQTLGWGTARWHFLLQLRPSRPGPVAGAMVHIGCGKGSRAVPIGLDLPEFTVAMPEAEPGEPEPAPLPETKEQPSGLAWLLLAAAGGILWFWRRRRNQPAALPSTEAEGSPSLLARLAALRARLETPDAALFAALSDLVAEYLQAHHSVPAAGLTLREQAAWLSHSRALNASLAERLIRFWKTAEAVRFAGENVGPEQGQEAFTAAWDLLDHDQGGPQ